MNSSITTTSPIATAATMSSREIAELTGKRPADVMRDIRIMFDALDIDERSFASAYLGGNGQDRLVFNLPKDLTTTLISGYSIPMRHKIVTRWIELEATAPATFKVPTNFREALLLAADQQDQLDAQRPAVEFVEKFVETAQTQTLTVAAKSIGRKPRLLSSLLIDDGILYRRSRSGGAPVVPRQSHIDSGYFVVKQTVSPYGHSRPSTRVTTKGIVWLAEKYAH